MALSILWGLYLLAFGVNHLQARAGKSVPERRVRTDPLSELGLAIQFGAVVLTFLFRRGDAGSIQTTAVGITLGAISVALTWWGLAHLGRQWRLQAVVTDDHTLITTGPYAWVRHPVYTAFFGMLLANILLISSWWAGAAAVVLFITGTEIRIRVEERLLSAHFADHFVSYRSRVAAWLPPVR